MNLSRRLFLKGTAATAAVASVGITLTPTPAEAIPVVPDLKPSSDNFIVYYHHLWNEAEVERQVMQARSMLDEKIYLGDGLSRSRAMIKILHRKRMLYRDKAMTLVIDDRIMPIPQLTKIGFKTRYGVVANPQYGMPHAIAYLPSVIIRIHKDGSVQFLKDRFHNRATVSRNR